MIDQLISVVLVHFLHTARTRKKVKEKHFIPIHCPERRLKHLDTPVFSLVSEMLSSGNCSVLEDGRRALV